MTAPSRVAPAAARILDLLAVLLLVRAAWEIAGGAVDPGEGARLLLFAPLLLIVRTLIEAAPPFWSGVLDLSARGARSVWTHGIAGSFATAVAATIGWSLVHPLTDYGSPWLLTAAAAAASLPLGLLAGIVFKLWNPGRSSARAARCAFFAGCANPLAALTLWKPATEWVFPELVSPLLALGAGALVFLLLAAALLLLFSDAGAGTRFAAPAALAVIPVALCVWLSGPLEGETEAPADWPRAVLLITIDTLRADHLGTYGYERDTSPRIDAFAAESVLFERAYAPMPTTDPSHTAILTGLLPRTSGVTRNGQTVSPDEVVSLASFFRYHGYRTGAVTSRAHLDPVSIDLPGFQTFSVPVDTAEAEQTLTRATRWIERHGDRPFFLWVHFWDPHAPYEVPPEEAARFGVTGDPPEIVHGINPYAERTFSYTPEEMQHVIGLYDAEIHHADARVGRLIAETAERYGAEHLLTVLTSDHGETLDEHDAAYTYAFDHGKLLSHHELHVPLIVSWPGRLSAGVRVSRPVATAAILPTVTELLGEPERGDVPSFLDLLTGADTAPPPEPLLVERRSFEDPVKIPFFGVPELGVIREERLYIENPERGRFLYDIATDPGGATNLVESATDEADTLAELLRELALKYPPAASIVDEMDPAKVEALRSLGYIQ
jgi:arylsulfatase A-like enzyme